MHIEYQDYTSTLISDTDIIYKYIMQSKQHRRGGRDGSGGGAHSLDGAHLVGYQARTHPKPPPTPRAPSFGVSQACRLQSLSNDYTFVIVSVSDNLQCLLYILNIFSSFNEPPSPPKHPPRCLDHSPPKPALPPTDTPNHVSIISSYTKYNTYYAIDRYCLSVLSQLRI